MISEQEIYIIEWSKKCKLTSTPIKFTFETVRL